MQEPEQFLIERQSPDFDADLSDPQDWDAYWSRDSGAAAAIYGFIAGVYRRGFIKANLNRILHREFPSGSTLLHAGCGSGQVDVDIQEWMDVVYGLNDSLEISNQSGVDPGILPESSWLRWQSSNDCSDSVFSVHEVFYWFKAIVAPAGPNLDLVLLVHYS